MRLLWTAATVSDIGTWVQLIIVGSLVAANTGSAIQTGLVALATFMPQGIASPIGGLLADRFDRRKTFAAALLLQAIGTTSLAVVLGLGVRQPLILTAFILLSSAAGALGAPSYAAMIPDLVPPEELMAMVSLGVYSWNSGRIIGPLLGTVLAVSVGPAWTVGFNALTFVVLALAVAMMRRPFLPTADGGTVSERLIGGWRTLRSTPGCWHGVVLLVLFNLTIVPFMGLIPIYAKAEYGGGTGLAGVISSVQGIGAIIGGVVITILANRQRRSSLVSLLVWTLAISLGAYALAPSTTWVIASVAVIGAASAGMFISVSSIIQRDAPDAGRGRVMSIMHASMGLSYGVGLMFIGGIADLTNLHLAFGVGAVSILLGFALLTSRSQHWRSAVDGSVRSSEPSLAPV